MFDSLSHNIWFSWQHHTEIIHSNLLICLNQPKKGLELFWGVGNNFLGMVHPNFDSKSVNFSYKRVDWFWLMCVSNKSDFNLLIFWGELQESLGKTRGQYNNADIANFQLCLVQLWKRQTFLSCSFIICSTSSSLMMLWTSHRSHSNHSLYRSSYNFSVCVFVNCPVAGC